MDYTVRRMSDLLVAIHLLKSLSDVHGRIGVCSLLGWRFSPCHPAQSFLVPRPYPTHWVFAGFYSWLESGRRLKLSTNISAVG